MAGVLVDSNVLLDLFTDDPVSAAWSEARLAEAFDAGRRRQPGHLRRDIGGVRSHRDLNLALPDRLGREALPWEAAFLAGKCFLDYRRRGGAKRSALPDFYIGAHAAVTGRTLLTRDASRYRKLLPGLKLHSP